MKNTSKLLFNEEPITINRLAARVLGLNEAIVIQQIHYWLEINRKAKINLHDDRTWTYNTYEKWQSENFDFWSLATLKRVFKKLFDAEVLLKGNYNTYKYDRTLWVSINYDKLDEILDKYERNVEITTKCQNDTMQNIKMTPSKVSKCNDGKCQNDTDDTKDYTKTSTEISTTQSTQNVSVVNTNKELIESKTHLLLDSKNKRDKVAKWNKDRIVKAIDIFVEQGGQYFSLLEKIYKDDKNFAPKESKVANNQMTQSEVIYKPNRAHNVNNTFFNYTPEQLEKKLRKSQEDKFKCKPEKTHDEEKLREQAINILREENSFLFDETEPWWINKIDELVNKLKNNQINRRYK